MVSFEKLAGLIISLEGERGLPNSLQLSTSGVFMSERAPLKELNAVGRSRALPKVIAIDLDDTLNNFTETLRNYPFTYDESYAMPVELFDQYLERIRHDQPDASELLSTQYSFLRYKIHAHSYRLAQARPDGIEFMHWLQTKGWRIVICTRRDLRRAHDGTRAWLKENRIPFDELFMVLNKVVFCKAWQIGHLVDDDIFNIQYGNDYAVNVYYPVMEKHRALAGHAARGFQKFEELKTWIQE